MPPHKIFLTIDDAPSCHMDKKISFLKMHNIPALFYVRGEFIEKYPEQVINAIQQGFLIGNHSYSHPYFSEIELTQCFDEVAKTEKLIDQCYADAKITRPHKVIRLPFADRGAGADAQCAKTDEETNKITALQAYLKENNFTQVQFHAQKDDFIDSFWDWDTQDYSSKYIDNPQLYVKQLKDFYTNYDAPEAVILLHDFDHNHHLFELTMDFLIEKKVEFLPYRINGSLDKKC